MENTDRDVAQADRSWVPGIAEETRDAFSDAETRYRLFFEHATDGFALYELIYDEQGQAVDWLVLGINPAYTRLSGVSADRIVGHRASDVYANYTQEYLPMFARVVATQTPTSFEIHARAVPRYVDVSVFPTGGHGFATVLTDVTKRKRAEDALAHEKELLQAIIDNIPVYLVIWDGQLQQFQLNEAFRRDLGWTEEDAAKGDFMAKVYPDPEYRRKVAQFMQSLQPGFRDLKTRAKSGTLVDIAWANVHISGDRSIGIGVNITDRKEAEQERERLLEELDNNFHLLQRALLPPQPAHVPGYRVVSVYRPGVGGVDIGGDFYDVFHTRHQRAAVVIGDVSGKGVPSASLAAAARSTLRAFLYETSRPGEAVTHANSVVTQEKDDPMLFVTVLAVVIDPATGRFLYSSAGHPPPMVYRRATGEVELLQDGNPPVGVMDDLDFREWEVSLERGDRILLYTDGLDEARRGSDLFGTTGIERVLKQTADEPPDDVLAALLEAALDWAEGIIRDDTAIILMERE